ncbi:MAG: hydrogenase iron-sulfur subunit [Magnetococcales bacterium]|nr:hydrogenase iron-sulfur subunit [Magnetococcales bacterium]MBF0583003.1 hydrogenase iron-sulfur subunit [Magnetococcales bacterium]
MNIIRNSGNKIVLAVEQLFNKIFGNQLNPFYHLGSLTFYFFWIVLVSGIYVFIAFETNLAGAYNSVEYMTNEQWWLAGIMRSLHRYASDAAIITIFLHMVREFCRDHYRGVRWFSWFTGVPTLWMVVMLGISGYWLVWDMLAQYIAITTAELIDWIPMVPGSMVFNFLEGNVSDRFFTLMAFLHLLGLPVALVFLLWTHVSRISQIDFYPPRLLAWGSLIALILLSLIKPAVSHGPAQLDHSPTVLHLDWFYLNIYPLVDILGAGWAWGIASGVTLFLLAMPWLPPRGEKPRAEVNLEHCSGCGQCAQDCPYGAITMQRRTDGRKFEFESSMEDSLCTSCGICTGSCASANPFRMAKEVLKAGIEMPWYGAEDLRRITQEKLSALTTQPRVIVYGCENSLDFSVLDGLGCAVQVVPCSGMLPPSLLDFALKRGADGVVVTGCREGDCFHRFGNRWTIARLDGTREPHLFARTDQRKIVRFWGGRSESQEMQALVRSFRDGIKKEGLPHA